MATPSKDSKPVVAGVLDLIVGVMALIGSGVFAVIAVIISRTIAVSGQSEAEVLSALPLAVILPLALLGLVLAVIAIVGGVAALRRRRYGLAVAGAIAALVAFFPLGVPALILTVLAAKAFQRPSDTVGQDGG